MSIETLKRRVDRIAIQVGPPEPEPEPLFNRSLFSAQELAEIDALLEQVKPRFQEGSRPLELLTNEELDALHTWASLNESRTKEYVKL